MSLARLAFMLTASTGLMAGVMGAAQTSVAVERTVYFTATTSTGTHVSDVTATDLVVTEGGRDRQILRVGRSQDRLKVCLAIDEGLSPDVVFRQAIFRFVQQLQRSGDVALYLLGRGNAKLVDYTSDATPFVKALNSLPVRAQGDASLVESVYDLARSQRLLEGRRAIVVLATEIPQRSTVTANGVLDQLRDNGIVLYASTLVGPAGTVPAPTPDSPRLQVVEETERDRVLNDGTRQSGGLRLASLRLEGFPVTLDRIRDDLLHQYVMTYVVSAGSKSDGRLRITSKRKGITVQ